MTISKKVILGFLILVALFFVISVLTLFSSNMIKDEGVKIKDEVDSANSQFTEYEQVKVFSSQINDMLQTTLKMGYINHAQDLDLLYQTFNSQFSAIVEKSKALEVYDELEETFTDIKYQIDSVYSYKMDEITGIKDLLDMNNKITQHKSELSSIERDKANALKVYNWKLNEFLPVYERIKEEGNVLTELTQEEEDKIKTALLEKGGIKDFELLEIELLLNEKILGSNVPFTELTQMELMARKYS